MKPDSQKSYLEQAGDAIKGKTDVSASSRPCIVWWTQSHPPVRRFHRSARVPEVLHPASWRHALGQQERQPGVPHGQGQEHLWIQVGGRRDGFVCRDPAFVAVHTCDVSMIRAVTGCLSTFLRFHLSTFPVATLRASTSTSTPRLPLNPPQMQLLWGSSLLCELTLNMHAHGASARPTLLYLAHFEHFPNGPFHLSP
jgi:hypothetical protein